MADPALPTPELRIMDALRRIVRELSTSARRLPRGATRGVRRESLSGARLFVLRQVAASPGLSIGELAARTHARQSTVSEVVARLEAAGLLRRGTNPHDARLAALTLTARGQRAIDGAARTAQESLAAALGDLPASTRQALADGLESWLEKAGLAGAPAAMFFEPPPATPRRAARPAPTPTSDPDA